MISNIYFNLKKNIIDNTNNYKINEINFFNFIKVFNLKKLFNFYYDDKNLFLMNINKLINLFSINYLLINDFFNNKLDLFTSNVIKYILNFIDLQYEYFKIDKIFYKEQYYYDYFLFSNKLKKYQIDNNINILNNNFIIVFYINNNLSIDVDKNIIIISNNINNYYIYSFDMNPNILYDNNEFELKKKIKNYNEKTFNKITSLNLIYLNLTDLQKNILLNVKLANTILFLFLIQHYFMYEIDDIFNYNNINYYIKGNIHDKINIDKLGTFYIMNGFLIDEREEINEKNLFFKKENNQISRQKINNLYINDNINYLLESNIKILIDNN